jgi:hypothetical protein
VNAACGRVTARHLIEEGTMVVVECDIDYRPNLLQVLKSIPVPLQTADFAKMPTLKHE